MCQIFTKSTWKWKFHVITFHVLRFIFTLLLSSSSSSLSLLLLILILLLLLLFSLYWKSVYYASTMLDASTITLCPQLCRHCLVSQCESIVANPIIYRLVPRPSRFEIRQCRHNCGHNVMVEASSIMAA